uniref:Nuclear pore complex protein n=1 Tax=Peronospora matthiolae TaxID=2874970 RepID=A0AAV1UK56_9STRA
MARRSSSDSAQRSAAVQRLMESADESLSLLASLGDGPTAASRRACDRSMASPASVASERSSIRNPSTQVGAPTDTSSLAHAVVHPSAGSSDLLHVKGVFPDASTEYVDVDPRCTTVGDLKHALCARRDSIKALGFSAREARVKFGGQLVQDAWLAVDCGVRWEGAISIVPAAPDDDSKVARRPLDSVDGSYGSRRNYSNTATRRSDPKLVISSISSVYQQEQSQFLSADGMDTTDHVIPELATFDWSLSIGSVPSTRDEGLFSSRVRPEEALFAEMAADFYANVAQVQNSDLYCEKLLRGYITVLQTRLEKMEATPADSWKAVSMVTHERLQKDMKELRDERNTWRLLFELRQVCSTSKQVVDDEDMCAVLDQDTEDLRFEMLEDDAVRLLEAQNEPFKVQKAVKAWLESMALENTITISEKRGTSGSRTLTMMRKQGFAGENVQVDPDAVLRDGDDHILPDDMEDEAELLKAVWLYVRAGRMVDAIDLCIRLGQSWRAASLSGGSSVGVSETNDRDGLSLERWGNPLRALWKSVCWRLSEQAPYGKLSKSKSLLAKQYEELIYAALSGNIQVITESPLCESWEDHCWAYLQGITEHQLDEILFKLLKVKAQSSQLVVGNNAHYLRRFADLLDKTKYLKRYQPDLDTLFDELRGSQSELVRMQANQPHRQIQAKLVTGKFQYIVSKVLGTLLLHPEDDSYNWDLKLNSMVPSDEISSIYLRFAAHFIMLAGFTGEHFDVETGHMILKLYIRYLVKHRQLQFVPVYASRLPTAGAIEIYVQMLSTIDDSLERELSVKQVAAHAGMDILSNVLQSVVERQCEEYRSVAHKQQQKKGQSVSFDVATTDIDRRRIRTIEFLCFFPEHRAEALVRTNLLMRQFLFEGKFAALKELVREALPEDSIGVLDVTRDTQLLHTSDEIDRAVREFLCWRIYIHASAQFDLWRNCVSSLAVEALSLYSEEKEYLAELMLHVSRSTAATLEVLRFANGWLVGCSDDAVEDAALRKRCLPSLVFNLHSIQLGSAKTIMRLVHYPENAKVELARPLLEKSIEVADVVADEHYGVYETLDQDKCRDLLHGFRESAISLAFIESVAVSPDFIENTCDRLPNDN